eukprot:489197-Karenia_brevis.AAC.1
MHGQCKCTLARLLPLVKGLPVRLTDVVDSEYKLHEGRAGFLYEWAEDFEAHEWAQDGEGVMRKLPL